jgi:hypothetical protein
MKSKDESLWIKARMLHRMPKRDEILQGLVLRFLFEGYYMAGEHTYVNISRQWDFEFTEEADFVLEIIWAANLSAFRRAVSRRWEVITADDHATYSLPKGLCLDGGDQTFAGIRRQAFNDPRLMATEMDLYYVSGQSCREPAGHVVTAGEMSYYFRSRTPVPSTEIPYAVRINTKCDPNAHLLLD